MSVLDAARAGDERSFAALVAPHRRELEAHCYRMLGSLQDAEDAVQETLTAAWRALPGFEGRSSLRTWLYRIATRASLRVAERRPARQLSWERFPATTDVHDLGASVDDDGWLEPWIERPDDPETLLARRETVAAAFVASLQLLPPTQRAVLLLRDVLDYSAAETAELLDTSTASVTSALQRARATLAGHPRFDVDAAPPTAEQRAVAFRFAAAFERADVAGVLALLTADVRFTMPPLRAWFDGRAAVAAFLEQRVFATPWRQVRTPGADPSVLLGYQEQEGVLRRGALQVLGFRGDRIAWIASYLDPGLLDRIGMPHGPSVTGSPVDR